jgi:hypothetical protein
MIMLAELGIVVDFLFGMIGLVPLPFVQEGVAAAA